MKKMKKFGIILNKRIPETKQKACELADYIAEKGFKVFTNFQYKKKNKFIINLKLIDIIKKSDMIFAIGGDGTILKVAREIGKKKIPLLGIKMGRLGFLMELHSSDIYNAVDHILEGKFEIEKRTRIKIDIKKNKKVIHSFLALNDVVIQNGDIARVLDMQVSIDNEPLADIIADGIIAATPTGSTAYSLSANGPIVLPDNKSLILTPICPHSLSNRPLVIPDTMTIKISVSKGKMPIVTIDGQQAYELKDDQHIKITRSQYPVYFIKTHEISYIQVLKEKLGLKGSCY